MMTASHLEKSDLGKNRFYSALNMPYPNGTIIAVERVQTFTGQWLVSVPLPLYAAICPHVYKLIADWLSGPVVVRASFTCEFLTSQAVDVMVNTVLEEPF